MAAALEDAEEFAPGAYGLAVLVSEDAGDLVEMGEVVDGPGGEQLGQCHRAEDWMLAALGEVVGAQVPSANFFQVCGSDLSELIE